MGFSENSAKWPKYKCHPTVVSMLLAPELAPGMAIGSKSILTNKMASGCFLRPSRRHAHVYMAKFSSPCLVPTATWGLSLLQTVP